MVTHDAGAGSRSDAHSPQAKGRVERPYGRLQDRIVRTCALENLSTLETARDARDHSEGNVLFRPFSLPKPYTSTTDVFCQRERGIVNAYRCISRFGHVIIVPKAPLDEVVELNLIPSQAHQSLDIRVWHEDKMLQSTTRPLEGVRVHL